MNENEVEQIEISEKIEPPVTSAAESLKENQSDQKDFETIEQTIELLDELLLKYFEPIPESKESEIVEVLETNVYGLSNDSIFIGVAIFAVALVFIIRGSLKGWLAL